MKKKKLSPLWLIPAVVIVVMILWCIYYPLPMFMGLDKDAEPLSATVLWDQVPETPVITYSTNDTDELANIVDNLRSVRGRFMGWFSVITYNDDPLLHLIITGKEGEKPFSRSICVDSDGNLYIQEGNIYLRAKDELLYRYLTAWAVNGEEAGAIREAAEGYVEKLSRVIYLYEDIDLREGTVLTCRNSEEMQYVVEKAEELKARRVEEEHYRTDWGSIYASDMVEVSEDRATVTVYEDIGFRYEDAEFTSGMGNEYTVTLKKLNGEWLVFSVEGGDTYSLKEMELYTGEG